MRLLFPSGVAAALALLTYWKVRSACSGTRALLENKIRYF